MIDGAIVGDERITRKPTKKNIVRKGITKADIFLMSALGTAATLFIMVLVYFFVMNAGNIGDMFVETFTIEVGANEDTDEITTEEATDTDDTEEETTEEETEDDSGWIEEASDEEEETEEAEVTEEAEEEIDTESEDGEEEEEETEEEEECETTEITIDADGETYFDGRTVSVSLSDDSAAMIDVDGENNLLSVDEIFNINGIDVWLMSSSTEEVTVKLYCEEES